uniref:Putative glycine rich protein n=1 Tax=Rhipicephalus pulchellus TaxID=72859 RepID=L7LZE4_RHIPC
MLSKAAIATYFTVLFVTPGTFAQNDLFDQSEAYCRRIIPPKITSTLGLCTYPCLLLSNDQPPKILVLSEPDGTACKIYNGFLQTPQLGNCRGGVCHGTQDYGVMKRMKRDVSNSVSSSQQNGSFSHKQLSSRRGSVKPKISKRERIELRRREMWTRCQCANMRGLFIDMSYAVSGLRLGRRGKRGRRRKVGCRVICFFLINKYKRDPKWASLFEARFNTAGSGKLPNATGSSSGGNRGEQNVSSNRTDVVENRFGAAGTNSQPNGARINIPNPIGIGGIGVTSNQASGSSAAGSLNGPPVFNAGGSINGSSFTSGGAGSVNTGAAGTSINGSPGVLITQGGTPSNGAATGIASSGAELRPAGGIGRTNPAVSGTGLHERPPHTTTTTNSMTAPPGTAGGSTGRNTNSGNGAGTNFENSNGNARTGTGMSGGTTLTSNTPAVSRGTGTRNIIGSGGSGSSISSVTGSLGMNGSHINTGGQLENATNVPLKPNVGGFPGAGTVTDGGTGSGNSNPIGTGTVGRGAPGAVTGELPGQPSAGPPTNPMAGVPGSSSSLSTGVSSSGSGVGASSFEGGTNFTASNAPAGRGNSGTHTASAVRNVGTGGVTIGHSNREASGTSSAVSSSSVASNSGEGVGGASSTSGAVNSNASGSRVISRQPDGTNIGTSVNGGGAEVRTTSETTGGLINHEGAAGATTASTSLTPTPNGGGGELSLRANTTVHTSGEGAGSVSTGSTSETGNAGLLNENAHNNNGFAGAASPGNAISGGTAGYGAGASSRAGYGTGSFPGSNMPFTFGGAYGGRENGFGNAGGGMTSGPWSLPGRVYNGFGAGHVNTRYPGSFGSVPGAGAPGYGGNGPFPGIYEDDIFFQE